MSTSSHSRRKVISAAAWSAPAIAVAAAAPAYAASPSQNAQITFTIRQLVSNQRPNTSIQQAVFYTTTYGSTYRSDTQSPATKIEWTGTTTSTTISNARIVVYYAVNNLTFTNSNNHSSCWTTLTRDTSIPNGRHDNGTVLYAYSARYTCPIRAQNGTTQIADFEWDTTTARPMNANTYRYWGREFFYTLNGVPMSTKTMAGQTN
ncbi:MAG: hypothetical protein Q4C81_00775 [Kocuria sp.]|nr:hypothetical protein [Kocuria sp.]